MALHRLFVEDNKFVAALLEPALGITVEVWPHIVHPGSEDARIIGATEPLPAVRLIERGFFASAAVGAEHQAIVLTPCRDRDELELNSVLGRLAVPEPFLTSR